MAQQHPRPVIVSTGNTAALTLGLIAVVMGVLALTFGWIPFLGLVAIPIAVIGFAIGALGLVCCLFKGGLNATVMPLLGCVICAGAIVIPLLSTGGASVALTPSPASSPTGAPLTDEPLDAVDHAENAYMKYSVLLYELSVKRSRPARDARWVEVSFKLKNDGDRSLDRVVVTVYFHDVAGRAIAEEKFYPLLVGGSLFGDPRPLKPGYIWDEKDFDAQVPSEWKEGAVEAKITDISFSEGS